MQQGIWATAHSYFNSNFSYCPLVWHFCSAKSKSKIEKIAEKNNKFCNLEFDSVTFEKKRLRVLAIEIFKTIHNLNPPFMKDFFKKSINRTSQRLGNNIKCTNKWNTKYGKNSLCYLGPILWNSLPNFAKQMDSLSEFKGFINTWGNLGCPHYNKFINFINS